MRIPAQILPRVHARAAVLMALSAVGLTLGCGDGAEPAAPPPSPTTTQVVVEPALDTVRPWAPRPFRATAFDAEGAPIEEVTVTWRSSSPEVAGVDEGGWVIGFAPGEADIIATVDGIEGSGRVVVVEPPAPPDPTVRVEARALWVTRWDWSDADDIRALMAGAAHARFNIVYFQVRARSDAYYRSSVEPWAASLTGTLGTDPGWDPLGAALEEAALHGIQVHAWLNAFIGWCGSTPPGSSDPPHAFVEHPEWVMVDANGQPMPYGPGCRWLTPGDPGVRTRLGAVAADLARRYPVDGVHLDFIRYPDPSWSYDAASLASWDSARAGEPSLTFEEHRRRLVSAAVRETRDSLGAARPDARLSAAVWGIYRNDLGWSGVSTGYDDRLQDARAWVDEGLVDVLAPMVYWTVKPRYGERLDFAWLADEHAAAVEDRHVYIGLTAELIGFTELARQIERARLAGAEGVAVLSARLLHERGWWEALRAGPFRDEAVVPPMPWRGEGSASAFGARVPRGRASTRRSAPLASGDRHASPEETHGTRTLDDP